MTPEQEMIERLKGGVFHPYESRHIPDELTDQAAAMIARLAAERDAARDELARLEGGAA